MVEQHSWSVSGVTDIQPINPDVLLHLPLQVKPSISSLILFRVRFSLNGTEKRVEAVGKATGSGKEKR